QVPLTSCLLLDSSSENKEDGICFKRKGMGHEGGGHQPSSLASRPPPPMVSPRSPVEGFRARRARPPPLPVPWEVPHAVAVWRTCAPPSSFSPHGKDGAPHHRHHHHHCRRHQQGQHLRKPSPRDSDEKKERQARREEEEKGEERKKRKKREGGRCRSRKRKRHAGEEAIGA